MAFSWESNACYLKLCEEMNQLVTELTHGDYFSRVLEDLKKEKSNKSKDDYILHLLRLDNFN
jgi:hypothetical protein